MSKCQHRIGESSNGPFLAKTMAKLNDDHTQNCFERKLIELLLCPSFASLILFRIPIESAAMKNEAEEC